MIMKKEEVKYCIEKEHQNRKQMNKIVCPSGKMRTKFRQRHLKLNILIYYQLLLLIKVREVSKVA